MPLFSMTPKNSRRPQPGQFRAQAAMLVFLVCLAPGLLAVGWQAKNRVESARALALAMAQARGAAIEAQFNQAIAAAEALGSLARQNGGAIPNFQQIATDLMAAWPGVATLELQPGGVLSDIVPRIGHERAIGFNALQNPVYQAGAYEALQRRALTVTGPLPLYQGMPGMVARVPIFQRGRDGREIFSGFVAATTRLAEALDRARLDDLSKSGYDYALSAPSVNRKATILAARGGTAFPDAVEQVVQARNVEFRLSLRPRGGWLNKRKVALEALGAIFVSGMAGLLAGLASSRRASAMALDDSQGRLDAEMVERKQAQEDLLRAKEASTAIETELKQTQASLQKSAVIVTELQTSLEEEVRNSDTIGREFQAKLKLANQNASELQARLEASIQTSDAESQASQAELEESRSMLEQALQKISEMQALLEAASRVQSETTAKFQNQTQRDQAAIQELQSRLELASRSQSEIVANLQTRIQQDQAAILELQTRLEAAKRPANEPNLESVIKPVEEAEPQGGAELTGSEMIASELSEPESLSTPAMSLVEIPSEPSISEPAEPTSPALSLEPVPTVIEQPTKRHSGKGTKRKTAPVAQLDFFGKAVSELSTPAEPPAPAADIQDPQPSAAPLPLEPKAPAEEEPTKAEWIANHGETEELPKNDADSSPPWDVPMPDEPEAPVEEEPIQVDSIANHKETADQRNGEIEPPPWDVSTSDLPPVPRAEVHIKMESIANHTEPEEQGKGESIKAPEPVVHDLFPDLSPVSPSQIRKAVRLILPLLTDQDPGAIDCLKDNRSIFRSTFSAEGFLEFERLVKGGDYAAALVDLKKAIRKHGIRVESPPTF